jgi:hypothetical protein
VLQDLLGYADSEVLELERTSVVSTAPPEEH